MNKLHNILILAGAAALLASCSILDSQTPQQSVPASQAFATTQAVESALIGAYGDMQGGSAMGAAYLFHSEMMADNANFVGSFGTFQEIAQHQMTVDNGTIENMWSEAYELINDVNLIIQAVDADEIDEASFQAVKDRIKGESLAIRGLMHFELVRLWAKPWGNTPNNDHIGVPIVATGAIAIPDFNNERTRNTVAEVYNQVESDLNEAIGLLEGEGIINNGRLNEFSVRAILARVNLHQGDYQAVADLTDEVIASGAYALEGSPVNYFENEEASSESVFDILHNEQDNPGVNDALPTFYAPASRGGRGDVTITTDYLNAISAAVPDFQSSNLPAGFTVSDVRQTDLIELDGGGNPVTLKYPDGNNTADNAPVMRYADVLLMNSEAKARLAADVASTPDAVLEQINDLRRRSLQAVNPNGIATGFDEELAYEKSDFSTKQELIDAILLERRVELAFEGQRKHDLARLGLPILGDAPDANNVIFPIPQEELDANDTITQNPGYGTNN